jgi:uncharacterized protein (TIGR03437 family)
MRFLSLFLLSTALFAEIDFTTGQAARLVVGQSTFTAQESGASATLLGAVGGLAYVNDMLLVADSNRLKATPINHRALIYKNLSQQLPGPLDELPVSDVRCPVCLGTADVVLGQPSLDEAELHVAAADTLRTPTAIASDGVRVAVADTDNNRVLIWNSIPATNGQPADVVVGQPDFESYASTGSSPTPQSLRGPQGVWIQDGRLFVADTGSNRVLIWNSVPTGNHQAADVVLGQKDFTRFVQPDLTKAELEPKANTLLTPVSVTSDGQRLYVADLGHNRVLIWNQIPAQNQAPADLVIGQPDFESAIANNSKNLCEAESQDDEGNDIFPRRCGATLDFPRYALSDGRKLFIADGGNDRILVFNELPTENGYNADIVIGQITDKVNLVSDSAFPGDVASVGVVRTPLSLAWDGLNLYASDPFNRRVLVFTMAEQRVANTGVRNAASFEVFAIGYVSFSGEVEKDASVTVTIQEEREHTYTFKEGDDLAAVTDGIVAVINAGEGDPDVFATPNPVYATVLLTARMAGEAGNDVTYAAMTSDGAKVAADTGGSKLKGGGEASKIAPGTIVSIVGEDLSEVTEAAPFLTASELPKELGGVQVYLDGIRAPLYFVSPTQINAQMPVEVYDTQSVSAYVRTEQADSSVVASNAIAVPIIQYNPGVFAREGTDPRPAAAVHSSSQAMGVVLVDGQAKAGDVATVIIQEERRYSYTVKDEDVPEEGESLQIGLEKIRDALIELINQDPEVEAFAAGVWTRIRLLARVEGPDGNGIKYSAEASKDATVILTAVATELCCANRAGAPVTEDNPALAGEIITIYATGLGLVEPDEAREAQKTGVIYEGPELNRPFESVSSLAGEKTANVLYAGLQRGTIGLYRVDLQLNSGLPTNPITGFTIAQGFQVSNIATIPVFNPNPEEEE